MEKKQKKVETTLEFKDRMAKLRGHLSELHARMKGEYLSGKGLTPREYVWEAIRVVDQIMLDYDEEHGTFEPPRSKYSFEPKNGRDGSVERHESFGIAQLTRPSGGRRLVGAVNDSHPNWITLAIYRGRRHMDEYLHTEHWMTEGLPVVEVDFSVYQWAELISSMNGTPITCTLDTVHGVSMDPVPSEVKSVFERTYDDALKALKNEDEAVQEFADDVRKLVSDVDELGLSKTKAAALKGKLSRLHEKHAVTPKTTALWAERRLNEEAERALTNLKLEAAASMINIVNRAGINALNQPGVDVHALLHGKAVEGEQG